MIDDRTKPSADVPPPTTAAAGIDVARLAHELRTPLAAISALAEIMRDERLGPLGTPRYRSYAADIFDSAAHANSVLAGALDPEATARATVGALEFVELDLADLVTGTVSALAPLADKAAVTLRCELAARLPHAILDRRAMRQILDNLIANALRFTPPGREIVIAVSHVPGGPVALDVVDRGDGMTPAELELAQAGTGGPEALRRRSGGSGIGLSLVRALAAACGASIDIDSALGQGTRVSIRLPPDRLVPV